MSIVDRALGLAGFQIRRPARKQPQGSAQPPWLTAGYGDVWDYKSDVQSFRAYGEKYANSPSDHMAVDRVIESMGMAGMRNLRVFPAAKPWEEVDAIEDHDLYELLRAPNEAYTQFEFFEAWAGWAEVTGNCYVYIHTNTAGWPVSLWIMRPDKVQPLTDKKKGLVGYVYKVGRGFTFTPDQIMHDRRWNPLDPWVGLPPSQAIAYANAIDAQMQKYGLAWFKQGANPSLTVESDRENMDPRQVKLMEREFEEQHTGSGDKMHKPLFLWSGFKAKPWGMGPKDSDFVEGRKMNRTDIWGVRSVHPALLTAEDINRANAETAEYFFAQYTILPRLTRVAGQMNKDLMPLYQDDTRVGFVNIVPKDEERAATVHVAQATATAALVQALGPQEGIAEAKRKGLLSADVDEATAVAAAVLLAMQRPAMAMAAGDGHNLSEIVALNAATREFEKAAYFLAGMGENGG